MKRFLLGAALCLTAVLSIGGTALAADASTAAAPVSFTAPSGDGTTVWKIGDTVRITWAYGGTLGGLPKVALSLVPPTGAEIPLASFTGYELSCETTRFGSPNCATLLIKGRNIVVPNVADANYKVKITVAPGNRASFTALSGSVHIVNAIKGTLNAVSCDAAVPITGFACDPADFSKPVKIAVIDDRNGVVGETMVSSLANTAAAAACGGVAAHGFSISLPDRLRDGKPHTLAAIAQDLAGKRRPFGISQSVNCAATTKPPTATDPYIKLDPASNDPIVWNVGSTQTINFISTIPTGTVKVALVKGDVPSMVGQANVADHTATLSLAGIAAGEYKLVMTVNYNGKDYSSKQIQVKVASPAQTASFTVACSANKTTAKAGETVTWTATVTPSSTPSPIYMWSGSNRLTGAAASVDKTYSQKGEDNTAAVKVTSNGVSVTAQCAGKVTITELPPVTSTLPVITITSTVTTAALNETPTISWTTTLPVKVILTLGTRPVGSADAGTNHTTLNLSNVPKGTYQLRVNDAEPNDKGVFLAKSEPLQFSVTAVPAPTTVLGPVITSENGFHLSCAASPTNAKVGDTVTWKATLASSGPGGTDGYVYDWTGTGGLPGNTASITKVYAASGAKSASVKVTISSKTMLTADCGGVTVAPKTVSDLDPEGGSLLASAFQSIQSFLEYFAH